MSKRNFSSVESSCNFDSESKRRKLNIINNCVEHSQTTSDLQTISANKDIQNGEVLNVSCVPGYVKIYNHNLIQEDNTIEVSNSNIKPAIKENIKNDTQLSCTNTKNTESFHWEIYKNKFVKRSDK